MYVWINLIEFRLISIICFSGNNAFDSDWKDKYPLYVYSDGTVVWHFKGHFKSSCDLNMYNFPFDTQVCYIIFGNLVDYDNIINATSTYDEVVFSFFIDNKEFRYDYIKQCITYKILLCHSLHYEIPFLNAYNHTV